MRVIREKIYQTKEIYIEDFDYINVENTVKKYLEDGFIVSKIHESFLFIDGVKVTTYWCIVTEKYLLSDKEI
jgi:hypothetical protein